MDKLFHGYKDDIKFTLDGYEESVKTHHKSMREKILQYKSDITVMVKKAEAAVGLDNPN